MRIGVIGSGAVGQVLAAGLKKHGYDVRIATRTPAKLADFSTKTGIQADTPPDVAGWAEAIVLAVKGTVIDTTNPLSAEPPEDGVLRVFTSPNESLMERLQSAFPDVQFVKAFNSVGNTLMVNPAFASGKPTMFYCGNDANAKALVRRIIEQFGWEPADMGTAKAARAIEPLCQLWCIPGFREGQWTHAFSLMKN